MYIENWNEQDHPRDEQGKFTEKGGKAGSSFEKLGFKKSEKSDQWHLKKNGQMHTITRITPDKFRYNVSEWDDKRGSGKEIFDKTSLTEEELNKELTKANNSKRRPSMEEIKELLKSIINMAVNNSKQADDAKGEDEMEIENEKVDKRKLISNT